jgi:hypothetical protein
MCHGRRGGVFYLLYDQVYRGGTRLRSDVLSRAGAGAALFGGARATPLHRSHRLSCSDEAAGEMEDLQQATESMLTLLYASGVRSYLKHR